MTLLKTATSPAGHRVTLTRECNTYRGAQPYYVITRYRPGDGRRFTHQRVVPECYGLLPGRLSSAAQRRADATQRAETIFAAFAQDPVEGP